MNTEDKKKIVNELNLTFLKAGELSLLLRKQGLIKEIKLDNTPVTNGDIEVNKLITNKIKELTAKIPIVSEESTSNKINENLKTFWLIDPIDGTHDYIHNKDEFTINAALIINNRPEIGIIYAPAKKRLFYSYEKNLSFELINNKEKELNCRKITNLGEVKAVSYSNELKPIIKEFHKKFNVTEYQRMKSSLKLCVVATGEYDLYVAEPRAYEWDIAAGHAILKNAGGIIEDFNGKEILYGKKDFKNPSLILKRSNSL
ncbi:3'(2'),5'-bisphosphate nucleotidase CysQ [Candidatus Pelagibacter sp.]|nr:3'(2'),5'-bisphosphate nucleotidase CysQ [Candidatus Pelagibacter sp.]